MKALINENQNKLSGRPYIYLTVSASADGRISKGSNLTMWEEMADTRALVEDKAGGVIYEEVEKKLRSIYKPQVDMLGSNSLVKIGQALKQLPPYDGDPKSVYQDFLPEEVINSQSHLGWLLAVDGQGRLRSGWQGGNPRGWYMLRSVSYSVPAEYLSFLQAKKIPYLIAGEKQVDLKIIMGKLKSKLGITCLRTSAGGKLAGALLRLGLLDEINIVSSPYLVGGVDTPTLFDSSDLKSGESLTFLKLVTIQVKTTGHIWTRYQVIHEK